MDEGNLTERQAREREFYREYSKRHGFKEARFEPVSGKERRPWNPYWFVFHTVQDNFKDSGQRVLDFGCGDGLFTPSFAKIGYEAWGFDISPDNIALAGKIAAKCGFQDRIHFSVQAAESLDYPDSFFDVVAGFDILHHVDIKKAARECHRVLKEGGIAVFKECVEVPVFDRMRNSGIGLRLMPKTKSFERHITEDEKKLTAADIAEIGALFSRIERRRFKFLSRFDIFFRRAEDSRPSFLEKVDYLLFTALPFLRNFGGAIVVVLRK